MNGTPSMRNIGRRAKGSRPLADFVEPCMAPALAKYGFGQADIITCWRDIAGERVASYSEPVKLQWSKRLPAHGAEAPARLATLILRVEGGGALELQHMATTLIERINDHLGWRCVGKLALRQAPLMGRSAPKRAVAPPDALATATAHAATAGIGEAGLREALVRLGARVLDRQT